MYGIDIRYHFDGNKKRIILRHDIDYSLGMALEMAKIDASYNIKSTFAVLLSSPLYNPLTPTNVNIINEIHSYGHYIALHHRVLSGQNENDIKKNINQDIQIITKYFPYISPIFVWHNPPKDNLLSGIEIPNMINAYGAMFTQKMLYISDSVTRHTPEEFFDVIGREQDIHLLLHPIIWMSERDNMLAMISYALIRIIRDCESEFIYNRAWKERYPNGIPQVVLDKLEETLTERDK